MARSSQRAEVCIGTGGRVYLVVGREEGELEVNLNCSLAVTLKASTTKFLGAPKRRPCSQQQSCGPASTRGTKTEN